MLTTKAEARRKWCPEARSMYDHCTEEGQYSPAYNRINSRSSVDIPSPVSCRCIASDCMMWRWHEASSTVSNPADREERNKSRRGFCGKAGKPGEG